MADIETPVPDGTVLGETINDKFHSYNLLNDTAGADAMGLVNTSPAANTILGRLKAIATALTGISTAAKQDELIAAIEGISPGGGSGGDASAANQTTIIGHIDGIEGQLASILAKIIAAPATEATLASVLAKISADPATQTTLAAVLAKLSSDPATQTTLAAVLTKLNASIAVTGTFYQATQPVSAASLPLPSGAASETTLAAASAKLPSTLGAKTGANSLSVVPASDAAFNIDASLKSGTATRTTVASGTSSATILASNANRKGATIYNSDANALLLDLSGGTAAASRAQVRLAQYQSHEVGAGYTGAITGIWEGDGAGQADVVEFT